MTINGARAVMMDQQQATTNQITVFYSYAHADERLRQQLETHLSLLRQQGIIATWHDRQIVPGTDWTREIDVHLANAAVILLLISSDFIASDYCYGVELQRAMERHDANEARVIPILLRPVADWDTAPFARLAFLPTNAKPITKWRNRDEAWADVARGIRRAIERLQVTAGSLHHSSLHSTEEERPESTVAASSSRLGAQPLIPGSEGDLPARSGGTIEARDIHSVGSFPRPRKRFLLPVGVVCLIALLIIVTIGQSTVFRSLTPSFSSTSSTQIIPKTPTIVSTTSTSASYSIFFGSNDNNVYGITGTGSLLWQPFTTGSYVDSSPIIVGNTLYFGSQDAYFYGIDAQTGQQVCNFKMGARTVSSPVYSNGLIYIGSQDHYVYAFTLACKVKWKALTSEAIDASAAVSDGVIYICSRDNHIYALRADNGSPLWTTQPKGSSTPFIENGIVYVGSDDGFYALDANSGVKKWEFSPGRRFNSPFVMNGVVYVATGDDKAKLYALNTNDGSVIWSFQAGGAVDSLPRVVNDVIYIGSEDRPGHLYAIRSKDGSLLWKQQVSDEVYTSVIYANGILYFGCQDSSLYALNANNGSFRQSFGTNGRYQTKDQVNSTPLVIPSLT